jgi:hypothetical protein
MALVSAGLYAALLPQLRHTIVTITFPPNNEWVFDSIEFDEISPAADALTHAKRVTVKAPYTLPGSTATCCYCSSLLPTSGPTEQDERAHTRKSVGMG